MKYNGKSDFGPNREVVVFPNKLDSGSMVITAEAVVSFDEFDRLCPKPPVVYVTSATGEKFTEVDKVAQEKTAEARFNYMIIQSLRATKELEFETIDYEKPETWGNWQNELRAAKFTVGEINKIVETVLLAQALDDSKISKATEDFLQMKRAGLVGQSTLPAAQ